MCGVVGVVSGVPVDPRSVERMRDRLAHRGPDHAGLWASPDERICLGHRRLSVIDPMPEANQPFVSHDGRFVVTFNGEIYNYRELGAELRSEGVRLRTRSDTEVLVEAFRRWGERCLERVSGMFAFAIWDADDSRLFCARDRAGEKPLYYALVDGAFCFASEPKAILAWPAFDRRVSPHALIDYLSLGFVADPKTIWEGCSKLPPAHSMWVVARPDGPPEVRSPRAYWDWEPAPEEGVRDWGEEIRETLRTAADEMAVADVPLGTFLSGGVDSSSVTAALSLAGHAVDAFTIGFRDEAYDERPWARTVCRRYGCEQHERVVELHDIEPVFERLVWHYDEPFGDYSYLPTFYVCREARREITVALSGDGGDELFAGYLRYQRLARREARSPAIPPPLARFAGATLGGLLREGNPTRRMLVHHTADPPVAMTDMLTLGFSPRALRRVARGALATALDEYQPLDLVRSLLRKMPPEEVGLISAMRYLDLKLTLAGDILVKVDRASMAVALEVRPVYLHRSLLSLAARIPPAQLAGPDYSKAALKEALRPWLPDALLFRRKMGFAMPLDRWIGRGLEPLLVDGRAGGRLDEWIAPTLPRRLLRAHLRGSGNFTAQIHALLMLDRWASKWAS